MKVILGIGNPGRQYDRTRHNLGFMVIDELAARAGITSWRERWDGLVAEWRSAAGVVLLVKPMTYVNLSGQVAQAALAFHKILPSDLLVVVDDLNLPLGALRLRPEGSAGGHNGLRDIEARLGKAYPRLRMGMGPLPPGADQVGFVLAPFPTDQMTTVTAQVRQAADCATSWLAEGCAVACRFNGPSLPPPAPKPKPKAVLPVLPVLPVPPVPPADLPTGP